MLRTRLWCIPNVIIRSPDTDVFFIALNASSSISAQLFFETGNQNKRRIIAIEKVKQHLGSQLSIALLGFHSFTGITIINDRNFSTFSNTTILTIPKVLLQTSYFLKSCGHDLILIARLTPDFCRLAKLLRVWYCFSAISVGRLKSSKIKML
jgi:hypothetical protein